MERDLGKTGDEPMAQEPEEAEKSQQLALEAGGGNRSDESQVAHGG